jgi:hypothetical protein
MMLWREWDRRAADIEVVTVIFDIDSGSNDVVIFTDLTWQRPANGAWCGGNRAHYFKMSEETRCGKLVANF